MFHTHNDLSEGSRTNVIEFLQIHLATGTDLVLQTKIAHWNVKGPHFYSLHKLFDKVHEEIETYSDLIAERIVQLGGTAEASLQMVTKHTALPEYPMAEIFETDHIRQITTAIATFAKGLRDGVDKAIELKDAVTADILTEVARGLDKNLWMVESHLAEPVRSGSSVKRVV